MEAILPLAAESFGLLSLPSSGSNPIAIVFFNAGFIHRSGPYRLFTRLSRVLAAAGYAVLRFDLPGVGDAPAATDMDEQQAIRDALDRLQAATGCSGFVIGGLCSAADSGWKTALADPRVRGLVMLDGIARNGPWHKYARLRRMLRRSPSTWFKTVRNNVAPAVTDTDLRDWPAPGSERAELQAMLARQVSVLALYTGGTAYFLHPRQFRSTFGGSATRRGVTFEHWPDTDHVFFLDAHRERLISRIETWMRTTFPSPGSHSHASAGAGR